MASNTTDELEKDAPARVLPRRRGRTADGKPKFFPAAAMRADEDDGLHHL
jgi:hypothetical protein